MPKSSNAIPTRFRLPFVAIAGLLTGLAGVTTARAATPDFSAVPGVVVDHSPASTGKFIGSPSLLILGDGTYLASHDFFGPGANNAQGQTNVFRSTDRGATWSPAATLASQYWSNLYSYGGDAYLMGTSGEYGRLSIRRSTDGGSTWTTPTDTTNGFLSLGATNHTAPTPTVFHDGRVWRAFEDTGNGGGFPGQFRSFVISAPIGSNLLNKANWTFSNKLVRDTSWLPDNGFNGWLEGNIVATREGGLVNILRVDVGAGKPEKAAIVRVNSPTQVSFDPKKDIVDFPGGAKKFTIRYDSVSDRYWSLVNSVSPEEQAAHPNLPPGSIRNTLSLVSSTDLRDWSIDQVVLQNPDVFKHGFQYADWQFDGKDLVYVSRTAFDDGLGGASDYHNANFLTFGRIADFRGAAVPEPGTLTLALGGAALALTRRRRRA